MLKRFLTSLFVLVLMAGASPASASTVYALNTAIGAGLPGGNYGTVTLTQNGANQVDVSVALNPSLAVGFVSTGRNSGSHYSFVFDFATSTSVQVRNISSTWFTTVSNVSEPGVGSFSNAVDCTTCGNGGQQTL